MDLSGKIALVTGGGTGIGKAISEAMAKNGARVAIASRNPSRLKNAAATNRSFLPVEMDIRKKEQVQSGVAAVIETWGPIDILVNNGGISGINPIDDPDDSRWRDIVETNLTGTYLVTKEVLKFMRNHAGGRIVNVSSVLGKFGVPGYSAYCATKHGVIGFTRALALEVVGRGITVNAICPGWVESEMARLGIKESAARERITPAEFKKRAVEAVPIGRFLDADEVAELALYLVSDKAGGITGQAINICGGQTMV
jgi:ketoreductase